MHQRQLRLAHLATNSSAWSWRPLTPGMLGIELEPLPRQRWAPDEQRAIRRRLRVGQHSPALAAELLHAVARGEDMDVQHQLIERR